MYFINPDRKLKRLEETPYERELDLQQLIADYPQLLGGDEMNYDDPRRFLLIRSEAGVALNETSGDHFSIDLLFVDQDGLPTLVEVKRSGDTRLRRGVIAQILDYAAHFSLTWADGKLRAVFDERCTAEEREPLYEELLGSVDEGLIAELWSNASRNIAEGKLRLVVVADDMPATTLRIIEYLNSQMERTEVFAVKIAQLLNGSDRMLASSVLNRSQETIERKNLGPHSSRGTRWNAVRFYEDLRARAGDEAVRVVELIRAWATQHEYVREDFGSGKIDGSIILVADYKVAPGPKNGVVFLTIWSGGTIEVDFQWIKNRAPFNSEAQRRRLGDRLQLVPGVMISDAQLRLRPNFRAELFQSGESLDLFLQAMDWAVEMISNAQPANWPS
jgi:hypothetical protein